MKWNNFDCWNYPFYDVKDKPNNAKYYLFYMLNRVLRMFEYENLPDTISEFNAERLLMVKGSCVGVEDKGKLYLLFGAFGGEPDPYYFPTKYTVANAALNLSKEYTLGQDCVLMRNDSFMMGVMPMFAKYSAMLSENDVSLRLATITSRIQALVSADNDRTKDSAETYFRHIIDGDLGVIMDEGLVESLRSHPYQASSQNNITQLIEMQQYLKASWYNDIGLQSNYNMKRESINSDEARMNDDALFPLVDDMERCRQESWDAFNKMFGTDVKVRRRGIWRVKKDEMEAEPDDAGLAGEGDGELSEDDEEAAALE